MQKRHNKAHDVTFTSNDGWRVEMMTITGSHHQAKQLHECTSEYVNQFSTEVHKWEHYMEIQSPS